MFGGMDDMDVEEVDAAIERLFAKVVEEVVEGVDEGIDMVESQGMLM